MGEQRSLLREEPLMIGEDRAGGKYRTSLLKIRNMIPVSSGFLVYGIDTGTGTGMVPGLVLD